MRIGLVGAGPVGTLIGLSLLYNEIPFHWVVRNPARRQQLSSVRFILGGQGGEVALHQVELHESMDILSSADWALFCVKAHHVASALAEAHLSPRTAVLAVANGIQRGPFHLALLYGGAYLDSQGTLNAGIENDLVMGSLGLSESLADELSGVLNAPFLQAIPDEHLQIRMWNKLALNCVVNPLTAIHDCPNGELLERVERGQIAAILREVDMVAEADCAAQTWTQDRWRVPPFLCTAEILLADCLSLLNRTKFNSSSMREDLHAGRETEIRALNGAVVALGAKYGIACPANEELTGKVLAMSKHVS